MLRHGSSGPGPIGHIRQLALRPPSPPNGPPFKQATRATLATVGATHIYAQSAGALPEPKGSVTDACLLRGTSLPENTRNVSPVSMRSGGDVDVRGWRYVTN